MKKINFTFKDKTYNVSASTGVSVNHWNNMMMMHRVTIKANGVTIWFPFYDHYEEVSNVMEAVDCWVEDCIVGTDGYYPFCNELGYEYDSKDSKKIYKECVRSLEKARKFGLSDDDLYDLANEIREEKLNID